jgi:predicted metal-dependent hydrolase
MVPEETRLVTNGGFRRGVELFNAEEFYECHEVLEDVWRPTRGVDRLFLQALIHFAVGFYHHQRGNREGAERQLRKALRKLAGYLPMFHGIDTARLYREGLGALELVVECRAIERYPRFWVL